MKNDYEIWKKFRDGDKSALSDIYFQHYQSMFQYGMKFKDNPEFIKDCIQDIFFMLIKAGKNLGPTNNIRFYLLKALKNKMIKEIETIRKTGFIDAPVLEFDAHFSLEEEILQKEKTTIREKALVKALKQLSERQREVIYLRYECGLEYKQLCEIMDLEYDSARKLVLRAIKSLKEIISSQTNMPGLFLLQFSKHDIY